MAGLDPAGKQEILNLKQAVIELRAPGHGGWRIVRGVIPNPVECFAKSPLILSFSPQARLGELATKRGRIRKRMWLGEGTPEFSPA